jgi:hypothetical protein
MGGLCIGYATILILQGARARQVFCVNGQTKSSSLVD